ncbi:MAG: hypothetical protein QOD80_1230, partial [Verrucomicrobiota bacterium]
MAAGLIGADACHFIRLYDISLAHGEEEFFDGWH